MNGSSIVYSFVRLKRTNQEGNGFDELRKYLKLGEEFCKDVAGIFAERAEIEADYAKSVARLATKASKVNRSQLG